MLSAPRESSRRLERITVSQVNLHQLEASSAEASETYISLGECSQMVGIQQTFGIHPICV